MHSRKLVNMSCVQLFHGGDTRRRTTHVAFHEDALRGLTSSYVIGTERVYYSFEEVALVGTEYNCIDHKTVRDKDADNSALLLRSIIHVAVVAAMFRRGQQVLCSPKALVNTGHPYSRVQMKGCVVRFFLDFGGDVYEVSPLDEDLLLHWCDVKLKAASLSLHEAESFDKNAHYSVLEQYVSYKQVTSASVPC